MCALALLPLCATASAGITLYDQDGKKIVVGGRIQIQHERLDPDAGSTEDDIIFRRLRPYLEGTVTEDWMGKIQVDFGKALEGDEVAIRTPAGERHYVVNSLSTLHDLDE